ncbi:MAG: zinc-ribbon domain-containing protein [Deltaproteobacteria bacterium]|nr:zinc-ribbon domain-containing protein [Deltaproteobacteria bacterium]
MVVTCPECGTKYRLEEDRIPPEGAKGRCSRCAFVFQVFRPAPAADPNAGPQPEAEKPPLRPRSRFPSLSLLAAFFILASAAAGAYLVWGHEANMKKMALLLSALRTTLGLDEKAGALITLEKVRGYYVEHPVGSRIFVVEGQAVNHWPEPRSFIKVRGTLLDASGRKALQKEVYCGNILSEKDLRELAVPDIEKSLSSQFGESFSNMNLPPRKAISFMIVFPDLALDRSLTSSEPQAANPPGKPSPLSDFMVEVVSSQKGSK